MPSRLETVAPRDYSIGLWLLKLGGLINLYFIVSTPMAASRDADLDIWMPAQIFFVVSAYRCFFPVRYEHNVVLHDSIISSIFITRLLATLSEIAYVFLFSHVLRLLNAGDVGSVNLLSWLMVAQVIVSQFFVWIAILTEQFEFYFYEELGWALIFAMNTVASAYLYFAVGALGVRKHLLLMNIVFGIGYLPWQVVHLKTLLADARRTARKDVGSAPSISTRLASGLKSAIRLKNRRTDADSWGGIIGLTWMTSYWATLLPLWVYYITRILR